MSRNPYPVCNCSSVFDVVFDFVVLERRQTLRPIDYGGNPIRNRFLTCKLYVSRKVIIAHRMRLCDQAADVEFIET